MSEKYRYTLEYTLNGQHLEEHCEINKDAFYPYGDVRVGQETRGQYGFMRILRVYHEPHMIYGKFIAEQIK